MKFCLFYRVSLSFPCFILEIPPLFTAHLLLFLSPEKKNVPEGKYKKHVSCFFPDLCRFVLFIDVKKKKAETTRSARWRMEAKEWMCDFAVAILTKASFFWNIFADLKNSHLWWSKAGIRIAFEFLCIYYVPANLSPCIK